MTGRDPRKGLENTDRSAGPKTPTSTYALGPESGCQRRKRAGRHSRTCPVTVDPPVIVPLTPEDERAAIEALTELLADLLDEDDQAST